MLTTVASTLSALELSGSPLFKSVEGAAEFACVQESLKRVPAAFVLPLREVATSNELLGGSVLQAVREQFAVVVAVSNLRDARGDAAKAQLATIKPLVMGALLGWVPVADYEPIEYVSGQLLRLDKTTLWWQWVFVTGYSLRNY